MGHLFIKRYYEITLEHETTISYVCVDYQGSIKGFVVGFYYPSSFYKRLRRSTIKLIIPIAIGLIRRPSLISRTVFNILRVRKGNSSSKKNSLIDDTAAELSSIAVSESASGIGTKLIGEFLNHAWRNGFERVVLTTDEKGNDLAHAFYTKIGFRKIALQKRGERILAEYEIMNPTAGSNI